MIQVTEIKHIDYNWFSSPENGEKFTTRKIFELYDGKQVHKIKEHLPSGEGDRIYYDIIYNDKTFERIYNPNRVIFY